MKEFLLSFLGLTLSMSVIILILLVLFRFLKGKITASCRYVVWILVIARLSVPFGGDIGIPLFNIDVSGLDVEDVAVQTDEVQVSNPAVSPDEIVEENYTPPSVLPVIPELSVPANTVFEQGGTLVPTPEYDASTGNGINSSLNAPPYFEGGENELQTSKPNIDLDLVFAVLFFVWFAGFIIFLLSSVASYVVCFIRLNKTLTAPDSRLLALYEQTCGRMGIKSPPRLFVSNCVSSPLGYGFFERRVVIPSEYNCEALVCVFAHELIHHRRGDLWIKLLAVIGNAVNWFNPIAYFAVRSMNEVMELSCDERVLRGLGEEERISYSRALLETAGRCKKRGAVLTTGFDSKGSRIKTRIENVLDTSKKRKGVVIVIAALVCCICAGLIIGFTSGKKSDDTGVDDETEETTDVSEETSPETAPPSDEYKPVVLASGEGYRISADEKRRCVTLEQLSEDGKWNTYESGITWSADVTPSFLVNTLNADDQCYTLLLKDESSFDVYFIKVNGGDLEKRHLGFDELKKLIDGRYSYEYDAESGYISYYNDGKKSHVDDISALTVKRELEFEGFDTRVVAWEDCSVGFNAKLVMYPMIKNNKASSNAYYVVLNVELYVDQYSDYAFRVNPVDAKYTINKDLLPKDLKALVDYAKNFGTSKFSPAYLNEEDTLRMLRTFSDGAGLYGKYGGKKMLYYVNENDYFYIDKAWCTTDSLVSFKAYQTDLNGDGRRELVYIDQNSTVTLYDRTKGEYKSFSYTLDGFIKMNDSRLTHKWDALNKTLYFYLDGVFIDKISYGAKLPYAHNFKGVGKTGCNIYVDGITSDSAESGIRLSFSSEAEYSEKFLTDHSGIRVSVDMKYDPAVGLYLGDYTHINCYMGRWDAAVHNTELRSNSDEWTLRTNEDFWLFVENGKGKSFYYVNMLHTQTIIWMGEWYEPAAEEEVICWAIDKDTPPELYVMEDGTQAYISYNYANVNKGGMRPKRGAIIDLESGEVLFDGGMTEKDMFDLYGVPEEIYRRDYKYSGQGGPELYDLTLDLTRQPDGKIRFESALVSYDGKLILKGYSEYDPATKTGTEFIKTQSVVNVG